MTDPHSLRRYLPVAARLDHACSQNRQNLLVVRIGNDSQFAKWFDPHAPRTWDLMLSYYSIPDEPLECDITVTGGLSKFSSTKDIYTDNPRLFGRYEYIGLRDDDVEVLHRDIDRMFLAMRAFNLKLGQPCLTDDSYVSSQIFINKIGSGIRFTNFIEVMMPFFSWTAFERCIGTFNKSMSTWGLDQVWPFLLNYPNNELAIVDLIVAAHRKKIDILNGAFYKFLKKLDIDPHAEGQSVWDYYKFLPEEHRIYFTVPCDIAYQKMMMHKCQAEQRLLR